jgi:hypothetical protein
VASESLGGLLKFRHLLRYSCNDVLSAPGLVEFACI